MLVTALLGPAEVRQIATRLGIRPTKTLGQNFVVDPNTVQRIVRTADLMSDDVVLEVGPGLGSLTLALLPAVPEVYAVEVDRILASALPETVAGYAPELVDRLTVVTGDALRLTPAGLPGAPTALVANLPYNVAVPVVLHLLATFPTLAHGLVMVQSEVADRLVAGPGSRVYGVPSVKLAWYASAKRAGAVPRAVFWPIPNVDSGLVRFTRRRPPSTVGSEALAESGAPGEVGASQAREAVFEVVDAAFAQRRKTLRAALARWAGSPAAAEARLRAAGVDPGARGEALSVEQFTAIAGAI